jgi:mannosidase alpha-like ER degradation enhancer 1
VGHYSVRPGHTVYINDSKIFHTPEEETNLAQRELRHHERQIQLRIFSFGIESATRASESISSDNVMHLSVTGYTALFGADLSLSHLLNTSSTPPSIVRPEGVAIRHESLNRHGCVPFERSYPDSALIVHRGQCTFLEKLLYARAASASAVIIVSDDNFGINPTANPEELEAAGDLSDTAVILLPKKTGEALEDMLVASSKLGTAEIRISMDAKRSEGHGEDLEHSQHVRKDKKNRNTARVLYINGHPLINTRLLV